MDEELLTARSLEPRSGAETLGLGWLIAITICGGISLFVAVGFFLAWRIKKRNSPITVTRTVAPLPYEASGLTALLSMRPSMSTTRLSKRCLHASPSGGKLSNSMSSRFSSRLSLRRIPSVPVLPPLPSHSTFRLFNPSRSYYRRSRNWLDEDSLHGPAVNKMAQDGWVTRNSWLGQTPTLPNLDEAERGEIDEDALPIPETVVQKQLVSSNTNDYDGQDIDLDYSKALPPPPPPHVYGLRQDSQQEHMRQPAAAYLKRANTTEADLRDILRSTEQRLRDGRTRSPSTTPQASPSKNTARRRMRASSSQGSVRGRYGGTSPSKSGRLSTSDSWTKTREGSATSIGSAANSLIAQATEELELPHGIGSPSRVRGKEWLPGDDQILLPTEISHESYTPQYSPSRSPQRSPQRPQQSPQRSQRRQSNDSDASSSLSTLYSVGDAEVELPTQTDEYDDPFVERNGSNRRTWESGYHTSAQKPLRRPVTIDSDSLSRVVDKSTMPPISYTASQRQSADVALDAKNFSVVLQPPRPRASEDVRPKNGVEVTHMVISPATSDSSFETLSVHDSDISQVSDNGTPSAQSPPSDHAKTDSCPVSRNDYYSALESPTTPTNDGIASDVSDVSSSPYSEYDVISTMLQNASPKRPLPNPPTIINPDGSILRTPLSPPPKSPARKTSNSSSAYGDETDWNGNGVDLVRAATIRSFKGLSVGNSVAELRRMNSVMSTYSNVSLNSTNVGDRDSPPLPDLANGRFPSLKATRNPVQMGRKHYLNLTKSPAKSHTKSHTKSHSTGQPYIQPKNPRRSMYSVHKTAADQQPKAEIDQGKENAGVPVRRTSRSDSPGLRDAGRGTNLAQEAAVAPSMPPMSQPRRAVRTIVDELAAQERRVENKRASADSLDMYDKDGFLIPSPDREFTKAMLRM